MLRLSCAVQKQQCSLAGVRAAPLLLVGHSPLLSIYRSSLPAQVRTGHRAIFARGGARRYRHAARRGAAAGCAIRTAGRRELPRRLLHRVILSAVRCAFSNGALPVAQLWRRKMARLQGVAAAAVSSGAATGLLGDVAGMTDCGVLHAQS